jgi:hypothetical protein
MRAFRKLVPSDQPITLTRAGHLRVSHVGLMMKKLIMIGMIGNVPVDVELEGAALLALSR